jgi:hypothetical protein
VLEGHWQLQADSKMLGLGPVSLNVRVAFDDTAVVRSAPLKIDIAPPEFAGKKPGTSRPDPGTIQATETGDTHDEAKPVKLDGRLKDLVDLQHVILAGQLTVERSGFFELVVTGAGEISIAVDGHALLSNQGMDRKQTRYLPLALEQGPHDLKIEFAPADNRPYLKLILEGDQVASIPEVRVLSDIRRQADATP